MAPRWPPCPGQGHRPLLEAKEINFLDAHVMADRGQSDFHKAAVSSKVASRRELVLSWNHLGVLSGLLLFPYSLAVHAVGKRSRLSQHARYISLYFIIYYIIYLYIKIVIESQSQSSLVFFLFLSLIY